MKHAITALRTLLQRSEHGADLAREQGREGLAAMNDALARDCREALGVLAEHHARAAQAAIVRLASERTVLGDLTGHTVVLDPAARDALLCP